MSNESLSTVEDFYLPEVNEEDSELQLINEYLTATEPVYA